MALSAATTGNGENSKSSDYATTIVNTVREEKLKIETAAKEAIEKIIVEKNALSQQFDDLHVLYSNLTEEHTQVCKMNEENRARILGLVDQNQELGTKLEESESQLNEMKRKQAESSASYEAEKATSEKYVQELNEKTANLNAQVN